MEQVAYNNGKKFDAVVDLETRISYRFARCRYLSIFGILLLTVKLLIQAGHKPGVQCKPGQSGVHLTTLLVVLSGIIMTIPLEYVIK